MKIHTFRGGLRLKENKLTGAHPIIKSHMPKIVRLPMSQHIGNPAKLLVKIGDLVEEGQVIGEADGEISSNIHSSVSGRVTAVEKIDTPTCRAVETAVIETGGIIKNWYKEKFVYTSLKNHELLKMIKDAGIVGLGGNAFPSHIKLSLPKEKKINVLIINGAESEPYLTSDHSLMIEKTDEIIEGIRIIMKIISTDKAFIVLEKNKTDVIDMFESKLKGDGSFKILSLGLKYPGGCENQIIETVTGRQIPSKGSPEDLGIIVENTATTYAIYEAIVFRKPLIERIMTYTGDQVKNRGNYKVRIGSLAGQIFDDYDLPDNFYSILAGGPMMGYEINDKNTPVLKNTSGIVVLPGKNNYRVRNKPCIRCSKCLEACPVRLQPSELVKLCEGSFFNEAAETFGLYDCIECGACSYICPSSIPITGLIRYGKQKMGEANGQS